MNDVVILGSGLSSLASAAFLARKGRKVLVLEQHTKPGGYLHCFNRFGDRFDTGAHYVGAMDPGQPFHTLLTHLGINPSDFFTPLDPAGFDVLRFPDLELELPKGYAETIARVSDAFPRERAAVQAYYTRIRETAATFPTYEFHDRYDAAAVIGSLETPLASVVEGLTSDPRLQAVFYSYCALHAVKPRDVGFGLHALVTDSLVRGPYGFKHGGDALAEKLVEIIRESGGTVLMRRKVISIENAGKLVTAVVTQDGERHQGDWVISGIHPKTTFGLLSDPGVLSPAFRERLAGIQEGPGIFAIYAAFNEHPGMDERKNYYYFRNTNPAEMFDDSRLDCCPGMAFVSPACRTPDSGRNPFVATICSIAPPDFVADWSGSRYGKRPEDYDRLKESYADRVLELIDSQRPGFSGMISKRVTSTPVTNIHFNGSPEGSSYGIYHSMANTGTRALGPRTHLSNLLITGQSCLFPGLLGVTISALRTSGHIIGIKPLLAELREIGRP